MAARSPLTPAPQPAAPLRPGWLGRRPARPFGWLVVVGSLALIAGAILADLGAATRFPPIEAAGAALSALAGLGLIWLPAGLWATGVGGRAAPARLGAALLAAGIAITSLAV